MINPIFLCPVLAILSASVIGATEVEFMDLRLGGGVLSNNFRGSSSNTITGNNLQASTRTYSDGGGREADGNYRGQLQLVWGNLGSLGGLILGAGIGANRAQFNDGTHNADTVTPVVDVLIGYGYAITKEWHCEITPFAGIGRTYYGVNDDGSTMSENKSGKYYEYGTKIGTYVTAESGMQLGIEVPYLVGRFDTEYRHSEADNTTTLTDSRRNEGFGLLVTLGQRF